MKLLPIIMVLFLPVIALAQDSPSQIFDEMPVLVAKAREKSPLEHKLIKISETFDQEVYHIKIDNKKLSEIIDEYFVGEHGLSVRLIGLPKSVLDYKVTLEADDTTVEGALESVLEYMSDAALSYEEEVTYFVLKGRVVIATRDYFEQKMIRRVYSVAHLTMGAPYYMDAPEISLNRDKDPLQEEIKGLAHQAGRHPDPRQNAEELLDQLIYTLKTVRPDTWEQHGGKGTITTIGSNIIVYQNVEMQKTIGGKWW